ncbi:MAG: hypothetical protein MPJ24_05925 [Pirellulaceae bacterium]|nr:hypothetical protein [Pirellulaceae bacterium]
MYTTELFFHVAVIGFVLFFVDEFELDWERTVPVSMGIGIVSMLLGFGLELFMGGYGPFIAVPLATIILTLYITFFVGMELSKAALVSLIYFAILTCFHIFAPLFLAPPAAP